MRRRIARTFLQGDQKDGVSGGAQGQNPAARVGGEKPPEARRFSVKMIVESYA